MLIVSEDKDNIFLTGIPISRLNKINKRIENAIEIKARDSVRISNVRSHNQPTTPNDNPTTNLQTSKDSSLNVDNDKDVSSSLSNDRDVSTSSQHDVGSHIDVSPRHSERSEESQGNTKDVLDSSDLRLSDDESVSNANKGRHNEDSSRHSLRSEREESLLHEETKSDMLNLTTQGQKTTKVLREELKEKLQPIINQDITNKATGLTGRITTNERDKIGSDKAIIKSIKNGFSKEEHFKAGENIEELFINAKLRGIYEDYKKGKK